MRWCRREPRLKDILGASIVKSVMEADGVDAHELEIKLRQIAALLRTTRHTPKSHAP
jgi:hypothetical protein